MSTVTGGPTTAAASAAVAAAAAAAAPKERQLTLLLIGQSGSGKTFLCNKLTRDLQRPVKVLNDFTEKPAYPTIDWPEALQQKQVCLIIEDAICLDRKQLVIVRKLLNRANHHAQVTRHL
jgi:type II secretory pathway predicted ATPase ExeA